MNAAALAHLARMALKSAWNRRYSLGLALFAIALSVTLLLGIERLRQDARDSFAQAVSGTDLVVGARGSPLQLLLYAVFRVGEASNPVSWHSVQDIAAHPAVAWSVPISLGDSHHGYAVVGTTTAYFEHFRYGDKRPLKVLTGRPFAAGLDGLFEVALGAEVAARLGYAPGQTLTLAHGMSEGPGAEHADKPFHVVGILARTGTPVDRSLHINLESMEAVHLDWQGGAPLPGLRIPPEMARKFDLSPKSVTAVLLGLKSRGAVFAVRDAVSRYADEPLMAVLPGVALSQLWTLMAVAERALLAVSALVAAVSLAGLVAVVLASLNERRRELAILRANGARPLDIFALLALEGCALTLAGAALGLLMLSGLTLALGPWLEAEHGILLSVGLPTAAELRLLGWVTLAGVCASLLPGWRAYRVSLSDGLTPRV